MARITTTERDQVLDILGRRDGYPDPDYAKAERLTGIKRSTLRSMVARDRQRNATGRDNGTGRADPADPAWDVRVDERQIAAVDVLAKGGTVATAAGAAGVSERTVYRWQSEPAFAAYHADMAEQWREGTQTALRRLATEALSKLLERVPDMDDQQLRMTAQLALDRTGQGTSSNLNLSGGIDLTARPERQLSDEELDAEIARMEKAHAGRVIELREVSAGRHEPATNEKR